MKQFTLYLVLILLIGSNLFSLFYWQRSNKIYQKESMSLVDKINVLFYENTLLKEDAILSKQGCLSLDPQLALYTEKGDSIPLSQLKKKEKTLVLRYSSFSCTPCVDSAVELIKNFIKENPNIDVLLIGTYGLAQELRRFKRTNGLLTQVYHVNSLKLPIEKENIPYLFILDKDMKVIDIFIPRKELLEQTANYLKQIKEQLK